MKHLLALRTRAPGCTVALGCLLFLAMSGSLVAQTTGAVNPKPAVEPSGKADEPPPGDCMPIGITASGDVVFPFQCRDFIERLKAADQKAAASGEKHDDASAGPAVGQEPVAVEEKAAANKEETLGPENSKPAEMPVAKAPLENRNEHKPREQAAGPAGCTRFHSYDPASRTYRSYDGRRLSCRAVDRDAMVK